MNPAIVEWLGLFTSTVLATGFIYKVIAVVFANFRVECVDPREDKGEINIFPVKWRKARVRLTPITRT